jgi:hypothetical protein
MDNKPCRYDLREAKELVGSRCDGSAMAGESRFWSMVRDFHAMICRGPDAPGRKSSNPGHARDVW